MINSNHVNSKFNSLKNKITIEPLFEILFPCLIIFSTNSVYSILIKVDFHFTTVITLFLTLWISYLFIDKKINKCSLKKTMLFIAVYELYTIIFFLFNNVVSKGNYIALFILILPMLLFIFTCSDQKMNIGKNIFRNYCNIMVLIAAVSLFFYFIGSLTNIISPLNSVKAQWSIERTYYNFYYFFFETQYYKIFGFEFARNTGIFPESPIYVLHLITAFSSFAYIYKDKYIFKYIILSVAIVTTFSTIGIGLLGLIMIEHILHYLFKQNKLKLLIPACIIILFMLIIICFFFIQRTKTSSFFMRVDDYMASLKAWTNHPIIGNGYDNKEAIVKYMMSNRVDNGLSNSFFTLLSDGGIYLFSLYFMPTILSIKDCIKSEDYGYLKFISIMLIMFFCIIFKYTTLIVFILSLAISRLLIHQIYYRNEVV